MTVITGNLVLSEPVADGANANNPLVGYHNLLVAGSVVADTEATEYPASNLANPSTALRWQANDQTEQYLTVSVTSLNNIDYVAIAKHNFSSAQIAVSIEAYSELDGSSQPIWIEQVAPVIPSSDAPLLFRFEPGVHAGVRIRLQPGLAVARAAVVYVGKLLVLERRIYVGHTPINYGRNNKVTNGKSENGNFLGRIVLNESLSTSVDVSNITPAFYRSSLDPFIAASKDTTFFFAWRPGDYADEVGYAFMTNDPRPSNQRNNGMMQIQLSMSGIV